MERSMFPVPIPEIVFGLAGKGWIWIARLSGVESAQALRVLVVGEWYLVALDPIAMSGPSPC
jgi:hypothetical protein